MKRVCMMVITLLSVGCRFGGGEGITADWPDDDVPTDERPGEGDGQGGDARDAAVDAGRSARDAALASLDARIIETRDGSLASSTLCEAPPNLACDPVKGVGCLPFTQCLEVSGDDGPAAGCVLGGIRFDDSCTQDATSTNCPAQHTCVQGSCAKYCYCDTDCDPGAACVAVQGSAFKVCE